MRSSIGVACSTVEQELRVTVATAGAILYLGLADYMGHCSARVPGAERIVIKPHHSTSVHDMGKFEQIIRRSGATTN